jgi:hypothetical protein
MTAVDGSDWAAGIEARSTALLSHAGEAEHHYADAVERLGRTPLRPELARAHLLYGEWLRRENRRIDARRHLRTAYDLFTAMGADVFAERARRELVATGEKVRKRDVDTDSDLLRRRSTSPDWHEPDGPTPRSERNCSSAPAPSNGTSARYSSNSASPYARDLLTPCPRGNGTRRRSRTSRRTDPIATAPGSATGHSGGSMN